MPNTTRATPELEHLGRIVLGADATAELHADPRLAGHAHDLTEHAALVRDSRAGTVEVDDVDPARPASDVALRQGGRVAVALLPAEVTLRQADRRPGAQVDGGQQLHHGAASASRTKLARSASPVAPDFSGWNCAPHSVPRVANAATAPP